MTDDLPRLTARALLEIGAVLFRDDPPFTLTSGKPSPVYVDCRRVIAFPRVRRFVIEAAESLLRRGAGFESFDVVAGGETAGIPYAAWLAERLNLPMAYIRKQPKGFGRMARIEGVLPEGARVLLVEDLASDGGSKMAFLDALAEAGAVCRHAFVVFHYGIFAAERRLAERGVTLHALATWADVLAEARAQASFPAATLAAVASFLAAPEAWQAARATPMVPGPGA